MSMILGLSEISAKTRERILADPPLIWQLLAPDDPDAYAEARARAPKPSFLSRIFGRPDVHTPALELDDGEGFDTDLDKAWHGLHFLLTGTSDGGPFPECFLLAGGTDVPGEDVGYGPARVLTADETKRVAAMLEDLADDELAARYSPARMAKLDIYPDIWGRTGEDDESLEYLMENLTLLRRVVSQAAERKRGLLISLT